MMFWLRKYLAFYSMRIQRTWMYPGSVMMFRFGNFLYLITLVSLWLAASSSSGMMGGYTKSGLVSYYLFGMFVTSVVFWYVTPTVRNNIINGELGMNTLCKPISYYWAEFFQELAWHVVSPLFAVASIALVLLFLQTPLIFPTTVLSWILIFFSMVGGSILFFTLSFCVGLLAFWFTETQELSSFIWMGVFLLGGQSIPISFFPATVRMIISALPFRYVYSFPIELYSGVLSTKGIILGFVVQVVWIAVLGVVYKLLWKKGLRRYSAYGG